MYQENDNQTRQKGKAGSGIEDVSSSGLEKSKEVLIFLNGKIFDE